MKASEVGQEKKEFSTAEIGKTRQPCGGAQPDENDEYHWIEIELLDEENQPVPDEEYLIVDGDGLERRGYLNKKGFAREGGIKSAADCQVTFPRLDKDAWERA